MRRVALAALLVLPTGCAEGDSGVINVPTFDSAPTDAPVVDSTLDDAATDSATADAAGDTTAGETAADSAMDSGILETGALDTALPDTADTAVLDTAPVDAGPPWSHTVNVDGVNDFYVSSEKFTTTSTGYDAYVTWDTDFIYVGYTGADIGSTATAEKWLFVYLDLDPGMATGQASAERYNTQAPKFPTGFGAEYYLRWRTDNLDTTLKRWDGASWALAPSTGVTKSKLGGFVELKIPRATLGTSTKFGLVTFMLNERSGGEWTYAGLYSGNFTDNYSSGMQLTKYLLVDTTSPAPPNATTRIKP